MGFMGYDYNKTIWKSGDIISSEKLNNMQNGIEYANSFEYDITNPQKDQILKYDGAKKKWINTKKNTLGTFLIVNKTSNGNLDKTWQEIYDAMPYVKIVQIATDGKSIQQIIKILKTDDNISPYGIYTQEGIIYWTDSPNGYPAERKFV